MIEITVLGSGTCVPAANRGNPGYLVKMDDHLILLDGGSGALRKVSDYGYDYREIQHILYTHHHPDHTFDFIPLLFALKNDYSITGEYEVNVLAPQGFTGYKDALFGIFGDWINSERLRLNIQETSPYEEFILPFGEISTGPVIHTEESVAYRLESNSGNVLVYSGDTGYSEEFAAFASGADLLIIETAIPECEEYENHSSPSEAAKMATIAQVKKVVFTHFYPVMEDETIVEQARPFYDGEILLAEDGLKLSISG